MLNLLRNPDTRRILIYLGAAGVFALIGGSIYAAAMGAVTPTSLRLARPIATTQDAAPQVAAQNVQGATLSAAAPERTIVVKGTGVRISVADTEAERQQGLSGRAGLAPDEGMLFVFPRDGIYGFWMKDMLFSIDIVWLASDGTVVYMVREAAPESYPTDFVPDKPARYVLELPAGWMAAHGVAVGDPVRL